MLFPMVNRPAGKKPVDPVPVAHTTGRRWTPGNTGPLSVPIKPPHIWRLFSLGERSELNWDTSSSPAVHTADRLKARGYRSPPCSA